jgi:hypothetical protein
MLLTRKSCVQTRVDLLEWCSFQILAVLCEPQAHTGAACIWPCLPQTDRPWVCSNIAKSELCNTASVPLHRDKPKPLQGDLVAPSLEHTLHSTTALSQHGCEDTPQLQAARGVGEGREGLGRRYVCSLSSGIMHVLTLPRGMLLRPRRRRRPSYDKLDRHYTRAPTRSSSSPHLPLYRVHTKHLCLRAYMRTVSIA